MEYAWVPGLAAPERGNGAKHEVTTFASAALLAFQPASLYPKNIKVNLD